MLNLVIHRFALSPSVMNQITSRLIVLFAGLFALSASARAVTIVANVAAPTVDAVDVSTVGSSGASSSGWALDGFDSADYASPYTDQDATDLWGNRGAQGQTFTTGSNAAGYELSSVTIQSADARTNVGVFTVRVGTISGTTFSLIRSETATEGLGAVSQFGYVTAAFDSAITLAANTTYAFDFDLSGSDVGFRTMTNIASTYAGGEAYSSGYQGGGGSYADNDIRTPNIDRIFHVNLSAIPEPSAYSLIAGLLGVFVVGMQRRGRS